MIQSNIQGFPVKRGKVRDVYDIGEQLVIVTTDRISAFDYVMPNPVPRRGVILTQMTKFWLEMFEKHNLVKHHMLSTDLKDMPGPFQVPELEGRTMLVRKLEVFPVECVARGYLSGSGWKEYQETGRICGIQLPKGLQENMPFNRPLFTPATKEETGHDVNISLDQMVTHIGKKMTFGPDFTNMGKPRIQAHALERATWDIYNFAYQYAWKRGFILADTKFEFGRDPHDSYDLTRPILIDEVLTPDSCRWWPLESYCIGKSPPSLDKQYVRDYLSGCGWDKNSPPPELPKEIVEGTSKRYIELYERLTGEEYAKT